MIEPFTTHRPVLERAMKYDLIIITQSKDNALIGMTQKCIYSCIGEGNVNVILVESGPDVVYDGVDVYVKYIGPFNYNRALNMGLKHAKGDIHILANNDLIFHPGWSKMGGLMQINGYLSASAISSAPQHRCFKRGDYAYEGCRIGIQLTGWCIFVDKRVIKKIGPLDETHDFWFSDNAYAAQLQKADIIHALITSIRVDHIESQTLRKQDRIIQKRFTNDSLIKFKSAKI